MTTGNVRVLALAVVSFGLANCALPIGQRTMVTDLVPLTEDAPSIASGRLTARFLGAATIVLSDGRTTIMTDGFFSRPSLGRLIAHPVSPNMNRINTALASADITRVAAIFVAHSQHDHVMDTPYVAQLTGATIVGSDSTRNVALGTHFASDRIQIVTDRSVCKFGAFTVTVFQTPHSDPTLFPGRIQRPLPRLSGVEEYREGGNFTFHVAHPLGNTLIVPSRGTRPNWITPLRADAVFLGVGGAVRSDEQLRPMWNQFVVGSMATTVYPIHWDNFFKSADSITSDLPKLRRGKLTYLQRLADRRVMVKALSYGEEVVIGDGGSQEHILVSQPSVEGCQRAPG